MTYTLTQQEKIKLHKIREEHKDIINMTPQQRLASQNIHYEPEESEEDIMERLRFHNEVVMLGILQRRKEQKIAQELKERKENEEWIAVMMRNIEITKEELKNTI